MRFRWFWDRISDNWIVSNPAACLFGVASVFVCLLTAFFFGLIEPHGDGLATQLAWGALGVLGPISCIFLWSGMRRYQEIRGSNRFGDSRSMRLMMLVGLCWTALVYYVIFYLPRRGEQTGGPEHYSDEPTSSSKWLRNTIGAGWGIFLCVVGALFLLPKTSVRLLHGRTFLLPLFMVGLLLITAAYKVINFVRNPSRR